jgi:hypothetical protein
MNCSVSNVSNICFSFVSLAYPQTQKDIHLFELI